VVVVGVEARSQSRGVEYVCIFILSPSRRLLVNAIKARVDAVSPG